MQLLNHELTGGGLGKVQPIFEEGVPILDSVVGVGRRGSVQDLCMNETEVRISRIATFEFFKSRDSHCEQSENMGSAAECIRNAILTICHVFQHKCKLLQIIHPSSMTGVKFLLGLDMA
jgi:hypothetical protein